MNEFADWESHVGLYFDWRGCWSFVRYDMVGSSLRPDQLDLAGSKSFSISWRNCLVEINPGFWG